MRSIVCASVSSGAGAGVGTALASVGIGQRVAGVVSGLVQQPQNAGQAGEGVEPHRVGDLPARAGIIRQHDRDPPLGTRRCRQPRPAGGAVGGECDARPHPADGATGGRIPAPGPAAPAP